MGGDSRNENKTLVTSLAERHQSARRSEKWTANIEDPLFNSRVYSTFTNCSAATSALCAATEINRCDAISPTEGCRPDRKPVDMKKYTARCNPVYVPETAAYPGCM